MDEDKTKQIQENLLQASNALLAVGGMFMSCGMIILGFLLFLIGCSMMTAF